MNILILSDCKSCFFVITAFSLLSSFIVYYPYNRKLYIPVKLFLSRSPLLIVTVKKKIDTYKILFHEFDEKEINGCYQLLLIIDSINILSTASNHLRHLKWIFYPYSNKFVPLFNYIKDFSSWRLLLLQRLFVFDFFSLFLCIQYLYSFLIHPHFVYFQIPVCSLRICCYFCAI